MILGRGYIGPQIQEYLGKTDHEVFCVDSKTVNYHDPQILTKFILNNGIYLVINCSGFTGRPNVDEAEVKKEDCWRLNVISPLQVASVCNRLAIKYIHISSGCIYDGYDRDYSEEDVPNFGLFNHSSFYSKSKHAFETLSTHLNLKILRVRMPVCYDVMSPRNYIFKIMKYRNLIDYQNSKTFIPDLCGFIEAMLEYGLNWNNGQDIYNVVNPESLTTKELVNILNQDETKYFRVTSNWVDIGDLDIIAPRSNCVLNGDKASKIYKFKTETEMLWMIINKKNGNVAA